MRTLARLRRHEHEARRQLRGTLFANELATLTELESHGLVRRVPGGLEVTNIGRLFIRNIAMRFAQHPRAGGGTQTVKDDLMGYFNRTCNW